MKSPDKLLWLRTVHPGAGGKTDFAAFFFLKAFELIREEGCLGFLAIKTISEGDTRRSGLAKIIFVGGSIIRARTGLSWSGEANIRFSLVHIGKSLNVTPILNDREVEKIGPFLKAGSEKEPVKLNANRDQSFLGVKPGNTGFVIQPNDAGSLPDEFVFNVEQDAIALIKPYLRGENFSRASLDGFNELLVNMSDLTSEQLDILPRLKEEMKRRLRLKSYDKNWHRLSYNSASYRAAESTKDRVLMIAQASDTFGFVANLPIDEDVNFYIFVINGQWKEHLYSKRIQMIAHNHALSLRQMMV